MTRKQRPGLVGPLSPKGRRVFTLSWSKAFYEWVCSERGTDVCIWSRGESKTEFLARCVAWVRNYPHSQLVIKGRNGRIQSERTYGEDPRRTKG